MTTERTGILLIHGTLGSPREYEGIEAYFQERGYLTRSVALPGHGPRPRQPLHTATSANILDVCQQEWRSLEKQADRVFLLGHSLGGMCALILASQGSRKLQGVITLAAPCRRGFFVNYFHGLFNLPVSSIIPGLRYALDGYTGLDQPMFWPWWFPKLYDEALSLFSKVQERCAEVRVPVLMAHSPYDVIVPYGEMDELKSLLVSAPVKIHTLTRCGHQVYPRSGEAEAVIQLVEQFILRNGA